MSQSLFDPESTNTVLSLLDKILRNKKHLLIVVHNNPDPDAIASASALAYLVQMRCKVMTSIAYRGTIGRAENSAMVKKLHILMKQFNRIRPQKYDAFALVDGQPGAGNTPDRSYDIVIDHHPRRKDTKAALAVIIPDIGATATILVHWLKSSGLEIPVELATSLAYAIDSETQKLGREANKDDINAYLYVYIKSSLRILSQIIYPSLSHDYYITLSRALQDALIFRNLICVHLGKIPAAEIVSEMADLLLRHQRINWVLSTGRYRDSLILSIRTSHPKANAGKLIKKIVQDPDWVGGHDMIAGGAIPLNEIGDVDYDVLEERLMNRFAQLRGYPNADWKPLILQ